MQIIVLGAGPAGLMAAHAAAVTNNDVLIFSKARKSYMRGAQYLHAPIPMHSTNPFTVNYHLDGTADGYRDKVYGPDQRITVSPSSLLGRHFAWDIRTTYDSLWDVYGDFVKDEVLNAKSLKQLIAENKPDLVISTIPAPALCENVNHSFQSEDVWVTEMFRGGTTGDNVVICSGEPEVPWYRTSRIHGWENTEYPFATKPPLSADKVHLVSKPIKHNCDCFPDVMRVGRYGTWTKGVLSHSAYYDVFQALQKTLVLDHNQ